MKYVAVSLDNYNNYCSDLLIFDSEKSRQTAIDKDFSGTFSEDGFILGIISEVVLNPRKDIEDARLKSLPVVFWEKPAPAPKVAKKKTAKKAR